MDTPSAPRMRPKQRYAGRFWDTESLMEIMSIYHGTSGGQYNRTRHYRTLISIHREQNNTHAYRKGYGPDWKAEIKPDLLEYMEQGRLPFTTLKFAAEFVRQAELKAWVESHIVEEGEHALLAAE